MEWSQQVYHYDLARWLDGDTVPPPMERKSGRNADWRHLNNHDVISMPDKWEYPWYASWDLAFHRVGAGAQRPSRGETPIAAACAVMSIVSVVMIRLRIGQCRRKDQNGSPKLADRSIDTGP
jgi:hypothetical protein